MASERLNYPDAVKELVGRKYRLCRSKSDRAALAEEATELLRSILGEDTPPITIPKLYNLASRLGATRGHEEDVDTVIPGYDAREDPMRLHLRDDPDTLEWSASDLKYLSDHWGNTHIEEIAYMLNRTETAVSYKARTLGLRNVPKMWDLRKVAPWLGLTVRQVEGLLPSQGLELYPCADGQNRLAITLVSTTSLGRVLTKNDLWKRLVDVAGADVFFIRDIMESVADLQDGVAEFEPTPWVSHGRTSLCPLSSICFGEFYDGYDKVMTGWNLEPSDLNPKHHIDQPSWTPASVHEKRRMEIAALREPSELVAA